MRTDRLEAFSDGVFAILITIMVLGLRIPSGANWATLRPIIGALVTYIMSFAYLGIYWNNHHHLLQATERVDGRVLWANLHLLFWLSLIPVTTGWLGENPFATAPAATYGIVLLAAAGAYYLLERTIIAVEGVDSPVAAAVGRDTKVLISAVLYAAGVAASFVEPLIAWTLYMGVAIMWFVPDPRIEAELSGRGRRRRQ